MPTLRPVVGYDKSEIILLAQTIGTYEVSIEEYQDCCSIVSRHPKTRLNVDSVLKAAVRYDFPRLAASSISKAASMKYDSRTDQMSIEPLETVPRAESRGRR